MKNLGLILALCISFKSFAQSAPIDVSAGNNLPADIQNTPTTDADVARAKAELEKSLIKGDGEAAPIVEKVEQVTEKQPFIATPVQFKKKKKVKQVSGTFADDLLMQVDTSSDGQLTSVKQGKVEKKKSSRGLFSKRFLNRIRYFQLSYGYMNSRWDKLNSNLKKGTRVNSLRIIQNLSPNMQLGLGLDFSHAKEDSFVPENIRVFQFRINTEYVKPISNGIQFITGLGILVADYNIRKFSSKGAGTITYDTHGNGTAFGLAPEVGIRFYVTKQIAFDLIGDYSYYFSSPQDYMSGAGLHLRASFEF